MSAQTSMLDLFRLEAQSAARSIAATLTRLKERDKSPTPEDFEPLAKATATAKSAARIVGLAPAGDLAQGLEEYFTAAAKGEAKFDATRIKLLSAGSTLLAQLSSAEGEAINDHLVESAEKIAKLCQGLAKAITAGSGPREETKAKAPKPKADTGMLELFRSEAAQHSKAMRSTLAGLAESAEPLQAENIEPLLIAAHSLDGAARIVNLDAVVDLAQAMEDVLEGAKADPSRFTPGTAAVLGRCADLFESLSGLAPEELAEETDRLAPDMQALGKSLAAPEEPSKEPVEEEAPAPKQDIPAEPAPAPVLEETVLTDVGDVSMLGLFCSEAGTHAQSLLQGLDAGDFTPDSLQDLMRAAHSIKGAARIVNLSLAVDLGHAMEEVLESARQGQRSLSDADVDMLKRGAAVLADLAGQEPEGLAPRLAEHGPEIQEICGGLGMGGPTQEAPASPQAVAEPKEPAPVKKKEPEPAEKSEPVRPPLDTSMLDLFRIEAETHSRTLSEGLVELETRGDAESIEPLMRAAHSIKGAARIVNLDIMVGLAHDMEDILESARQGKSTVSPEQIDVLLAGADIFMDLSQQHPEDMEERITFRAEDVKDIRAALAGKAPLTVKPNIEPEPEPPTPTKAEPVPEPKKAPAAGPKPLTIDVTMLDLFRVEAETHSQTLSEGLVELEAEGGAERIEPLMRAAHSIKGAARIINLDLAVTLAHDMEDLLEAARQGKLTLSAAQIDLLLAGSDIFSDLSRQSPEDIESRLEKRKQDIHDLCDHLTGKPVAKDTSAAPKLAVDEPVIDTATPPAPEPLTKAEPGEGGEPAPSVPPPPDPQAAKTQFRKTDSIVRVSAEHLSRLMGMAGESLVQAKRLAPFTVQVISLKDQLAGLSRTLELLNESLGELSESQGAHQYMTETQEKVAMCRQDVTGSLEILENIARRSENITNRLYNEVIRSRMRPFADAVRGFPRLVRDVARELGKKVRLDISGDTTEVDRDILEKLEAPLNHIIRNSVDHGIEIPEEREAQDKDPVGRVYLKAVHRAGMLWITAGDDGRGLDKERIRARVIERNLAPKKMAEAMSDAELMDFLFLPGFTTTDKVTRISGRGVGLDVVQSMVQEVGGSVMAESSPGKGIQFTLTLPLTLSVLRTLLADVKGEPYAFPLTRVDRIAEISADEIETVEERQYYNFGGDRIGLVSARQVLGLGDPSHDSHEFKVVVLSDRLNRYGLVVDGFLGERDLAVQPLDPRLGKIPDLAAAALMEDGSPVLIMDVEDLVRSMDNMLSGGRLGKVGLLAEDVSRIKRILVVDDSLTVREVERKLLENHGYQVEVAVDGMDGFNAALSGRYDLILSDVDMPRMTGIELVRKVRASDDIKDIPIMIVSYKDREEERRAGLDAGANYYLTKSSFHDETLLEAVRDLIGGPRE
ncbi:MAG: hybrid sensor histidine kinase/response regulator [Desulfovibrio sp.]|nr:MAG: hybrid sensor histidine kinase/response regulator [Desulfovibrio sp.]